jgi:hypothetical protein
MMGMVEAAEMVEAAGTVEETGMLEAVEMAVEMAAEVGARVAAVEGEEAMATETAAGTGRGMAAETRITGAAATATMRTMKKKTRIGVTETAAMTTIEVRCTFFRSRRLPVKQ